MGAAVSKSVQRAGLIAGNDDRVRTDVINIAITCLRNVLLPTGPLPGFGPHFSHFFGGKAWVGIALGIEVGITEKVISRGEQRGRGGHRVGR